MTEILFPLLVFAATTSFTPGPNNVMLTSSGATFGFRRTMPHMAGVAIGFPVMVVAVGLGLATILIASPLLHTILQYGGAAYLCYLAWMIATADTSSVDAVSGAGRPIGFWRAAAFQWVNPKAWIMAVGAISTFTSGNGNPFAEVLVVAAAFMVVGFPSSASWAAFGTLIGRFLGTGTRLRTFNMAMAILLVLSLIPTLA